MSNRKRFICLILGPVIFALSALLLYHLWRTCRWHLPVDDLLVDHRPSTHYDHRLASGHCQCIPKYGAHDGCHLSVFL